MLLGQVLNVTKDYQQQLYLYITQQEYSFPFSYITEDANMNIAAIAKAGQFTQAYSWFVPFWATVDPS